ncbi:MAG: hypothetical protein KAH84_04150 [Thiomargarita sp.]|nr:hypothetical protein [Thiomargarita sp.]
MIKKVSSKNTKADILAAFEELETAYHSVTVSQTETVQVTSGETKQAKIEQPLANSVETQGSIGEVVSSLNQLGEQFNRALSQLSTNLLEEATQLKKVHDQVGSESNRLTSLYNLTIENDDTLSSLLKQYVETEKKNQTVLTQKQEAAEQSWLKKNQSWQAETEETELRLKEQEQLDKKTQKRGDVEYSYDLSLQRNISQEEYVQLQQQEQQGLDESAEKSRKEWNEREKELAEREQKFEEYKTKVEKHPDGLKTAIKKSKEEGAGIARSQAKIKSDLAAKEFVGEEEVYQLMIHDLETQTTDQTKQIDKLAKQLEAAQKQAQELAIKAIEGASNHSSFESLKEIAMEQAKNQTKTK